MASKYGDISQASWLQICPFCKSRRFCQNTLFRSPKGFLKGEKFTLTCCSTINHKNRNKPSLASTILSKKKKNVRNPGRKHHRQVWQPPDLESYVAIAVSWVYPLSCDLSCYVVLGEISGWHVDRICWTTWTVETNGCILKRLVHSLYLPTTNIYKV